MMDLELKFEFETRQNEFGYFTAEVRMQRGVAYAVAAGATAEEAESHLRKGIATALEQGRSYDPENGFAVALGTSKLSWLDADRMKDAARYTWLQSPTGTAWKIQSAIEKHRKGEYVHTSFRSLLFYERNGRIWASMESETVGSHMQRELVIAHEAWTEFAPLPQAGERWVVNIIYHGALRGAKGLFPVRWALPIKKVEVTTTED